MLDLPKKLLIADKDTSLLTVLSQHFSQLGYEVRSAEGECSALLEIEKELPDVFLSDLNMGGIPGEQFLLMVRRMFPSIRVIAMSGAHSGSRVPLGVAADAFFGKGSSLHLLPMAVDAMTRPGRSTIRLSVESLFGFQFFESIPSHSGSVGPAFPPLRSIAAFAPQGSDGSEHSQGQKKLPGNLQKANSGHDERDVP
jgi:CheY-like chemotaxis protein